MKLLHGALIVLATACIGMLAVITLSAHGSTWVVPAEVSIAIVVTAFLLSRVSRLTAMAFLVASFAIATNQIFLSFRYLTIVNGGFLALRDALGALTSIAVTSAIVAAVTATAFSFRRVWLCVIIILVLIAATWPVSISGLSI